MWFYGCIEFVFHKKKKIFLLHYKKIYGIFANDMRCPKGLNRESGASPEQFPLL